MDRAYIVEKGGDFYPIYFDKTFNKYVSFTFRSKVGGCDLGLQSVKFFDYDGAYEFLKNKGYKIIEPVLEDLDYHLFFV